RVELQRAEEGLLVQSGQGIAHLVGVGRAGLLDGEHERQARGGRLGAVVLRLPAVVLLGDGGGGVPVGTEPLVAARGERGPLGRPVGSRGGSAGKVGASARRGRRRLLGDVR